MSAQAVRAHPAYTHLFRVYRNAVADWHASDAIRDAARTLEMGARAYADARLRANQFSWPSTTTTGALTPEHFDVAYDDAVRDVCGVVA